MNTKNTARQRAITMGAAIMLLAPALSAPRLEHPRAVLMAQDAPAAQPEADAAEPDAAGVKLAGAFVAALRIEDEAKRLAAVLPLLHRSLLTEDGKDIDPSVKRVAWKKAVANAGGLESPVRVARVRSKGNLTIGEGSKNVEQGRVDDYFLARRDPDALPARVTLFFGAKGEPKIYDVSGI